MSDNDSKKTKPTEKENVEQRRTHKRKRERLRRAELGDKVCPQKTTSDFLFISSSLSLLCLIHYIYSSPVFLCSDLISSINS